jgi:hypothetical protein
MAQAHRVISSHKPTSTERVRVAPRAVVGEPVPKNKPPSQLGQPQLLVSRRDTARLLGNVSVATVIRLEQSERLTPIRLDPTKMGLVFYAWDQVMAVASGVAHAEA